MKIDELRAISIKQPWADLILKGVKTIEIRNWEVKKRGPVILHVSNTMDWKTIHLLDYEEPLALTRGRLIAYAEIRKVIKFDRKSWVEHFEQHRVVHPMIKETWGVVLENVKEFRNPIPHKGMLYFFPINSDKLERLAEELSFHRLNDFQKS